MDAPGYCIGFLLLLAGILPTAAYGAISVSPADFLKARACFVLASICAFSAVIVWDISSATDNAWKICVSALVFTCCFVCALEGMRWLGYREAAVRSQQGGNKAEDTPTSLRLRFVGGATAPIEVRKENIASWYVVWTGDFSISSIEADGQTITKHVFPRTWVFNIQFDQPITLRQLVVEPALADFPYHEIKMVTKTHAIFTTFGDHPPPCIVDIYALF